MPSPTNSKLSQQVNSEPVGYWGQVEAAVEVLANLLQAGSMVNVPYDNFAYTYYGSTNNVQTVVYKKGSTVVRTLTYTYVSDGVADDDLPLTVTAS